MMMFSVDGGRSFQKITNGWSKYSFNEIIPVALSGGGGGGGGGDGRSASFYSLGYGTKFSNLTTNTTATQLGWRGQLLGNGSISVRCSVLLGSRFNLWLRR
jgi:hypothetical protein